MSHTECNAHDDHELVRAFRGGDRDAMGTLFQRHHRRVVQDLLSRCGDQGRAEEAAMDAWTIVLAKIACFDESRSFWAWLVTLGRRCLFTNWRHNRRQQPLGQDGNGEMQQRFRELSPASIESARVAEVLERLDPSDRQVLELKYIQGHSLQEISDLLEIPPGTVGSRLSKARDSFRRKMGS